MVSSGSSRHAALLRALRWVAVSSLVADAARCVAVTVMSLPRRGSRTLSHRGARKALSHPRFAAIISFASAGPNARRHGSRRPHLHGAAGDTQAGCPGLLLMRI